MKCLNCGLVYANEYAYCPNCGAAAPVAEPISLNPAADRVTFALRDKLFLAICILYSAGTFFAFLCASFPVIQILLTIFLWITYSNTLKNVDTSSNIRCISGTIYASYIVQYISSGIYIFCGIFLSIFFLGLGNASDFLDEMMSELEGSLQMILPQYSEFPNDFFIIFLQLLGPILIVTGVLVLIFNILGIRKIHRFFKSVHMSMNFQTPFLENPNSAKNWLIFFTVIQGLATLFSISNLFSLLSVGSIFAAMILITILVRKYFAEPNN